MSRVPSGLPSSTMMISQFRLLSFVFSLVMGLGGWGEGGDGEVCVLLAKGPLQEPDDDREVLALVVGRQDDRVFVFGGAHCEKIWVKGMDSVR